MHCMSMRMHCVQTDEGKEKKKKTYNEGGGREYTGVRMCSMCVWMHMSGKR